MTKQRLNSKAKLDKTASPARPANPEASNSTAGRGSPHAVGPTPQATPASTRSSAYFEAVALYEGALAALQEHNYHLATEQLNSVLRLYPDEKELHERVRLYLNVCERQAAPQEAAPITVEERLYAATLAINGTRYDEALKHLRLVRDEDPDNDHALYMLAVAHAQRQEPAEAIAHLERALALNPENRAIARHDPDLDPLRGNEAFRAALDATSQPRSAFAGRRPPAARTKTGR